MDFTSNVIYTIPRLEEMRKKATENGFSLADLDRWIVSVIEETLLVQSIITMSNRNTLDRMNNILSEYVYMIYRIVRKDILENHITEIIKLEYVSHDSVVVHCRGVGH